TGHERPHCPQPAFRPRRPESDPHTGGAMQLPRTVPATTAIQAIPPRSTIVAAPGCGTPETLLTALGELADTLKSVRLCAGLHPGAYPFLEASAAGHLPYLTWHPYGPARSALSPGKVDYVPAR